jgi:hypothetical protein
VPQLRQAALACQPLPDAFMLKVVDGMFKFA